VFLVVAQKQIPA